MLPYIVSQLQNSKYSSVQTMNGNITSLPNVGVELGQITDIVLKGNTLFNYANNGDNYANWTVVGAGTTKSANGIHLVANSTSDRAVLPINLKPSTKYTVVYNIKAKTAGNTLNTVSGTVTDSYLIPSTLGINKFVWTTPATITINEFRLALGTLETDGNYIDFEIYSILEGDYSGDAGVNKPLKYGIVSTDCGLRLTSTKNLFDKTKTPGFKSSNTQVEVIDTGIRVYSTVAAPSQSVDYHNIKVEPGKTYKLSWTHIVTSGAANVRADKQQGGVITSSAVSPLTINVPSDTSEIKLIFYCTSATAAIGNVSYTNLQLEQSSVTEYTSFGIGGRLYTPPIGKSLPNGVNDEYYATEGKLVQNNKKYILQASDITAIDTSQSTVDWVRINKQLDDVLYGNSVTSQVTSNMKFVDGFASGNNYTNGTPYTQINYSNTQFCLGFPKGTYADITAARTDLITNKQTSVIYQLVESKVTKYPPQSLIGYPSGTLIVEQITKQTLTHGEGMTLLYPVKAIESITKVENNIRTPIDLTTIKLCRYASTTTTASGTTTTNITITGHGLSVGDRVRVRGVIRRVNTVVDANNVTVNSVTGMTIGDSIDLYKTTITDVQKTAIIGVESVSSNNEYEIIYEYPNENSTLPTIIYSFPQNLRACVDANTKSISSLSKSVNDLNDFTVATLINFETRLTLHGI